MGTVLQAGLGQNPARQAALGAGIPAEVGCFTVNKVCGSGLKAVMLAANAIRLGDGEVHRRRRHGEHDQRAVPRARRARRPAPRPRQARRRDGPRRPVGRLQGLPHGQHRRAGRRAVRRHPRGPGRLRRREPPAGRRGDGERRASTTRSSRSRSRAARATVTVVEHGRGRPRRHHAPRRWPSCGPPSRRTARSPPANASQINDGASAVVVMAADEAEKRGLKPLARIVGYATGGVEPKWVMNAPVVACEKLAKMTGKQNADFDLIEVNEAFSSAACAVTAEAKMPRDKVNVNGGAVALGHPIGASGARFLTTLLYALKNRDAQDRPGHALPRRRQRRRDGRRAPGLSRRETNDDLPEGRRGRRRHDGQRHRPGLRGGRYAGRA